MRKSLVIKVDTTKLTEEQVMNLTLEMCVQAEDYKVGLIEAKEESYETVDGSGTYPRSDK